MKKVERTIAGLLCTAMLSAAAACGAVPGVPAIDAANYMNTFLDMVVRGETAAYADLTGLTEEQAQEEYLTITEALKDAFADTGASEESVSAFQMAYFDLLRNAHCTVVNAQPAEGGYDVTMEIEPIVGVFDEMVENLRSDTITAIVNGVADGDNLNDWLLGHMAESVEEQLDSLTYGEAQTVTIRLVNTENGIQMENEAENSAMLAKLFVDTSALTDAVAAEKEAEAEETPTEEVPAEEAGDTSAPDEGDSSAAPAQPDTAQS